MLPTLLFGRTGHESSRVLFGAAALFPCSQAEPDTYLNLDLERGIDHIDAAPPEAHLRDLVEREGIEPLFVRGFAPPAP